MVDLALEKQNKLISLIEKKKVTPFLQKTRRCTTRQAECCKNRKNKKGQQSFDFETRGSIDDIDDDPEQLQALTDATDPNAQSGVVEVANLEETYDPAEYDQEVVTVIDENIENTGFMNAHVLVVEKK